MRPPRLLLLVLLLLGALVRAEEPFFKKGDVIAIVGGEDMVALSEYGYLELLLTRALPDYHLRFRNLAWEGDTVFEQRRDLNFPTWEEQLEKIGATVVLCQFGQMESFAGKKKRPEFVAAYEKLLARLSNGGKRRLVLVLPFSDNEPKRTEFTSPHSAAEFEAEKAEMRAPNYSDFALHYATSHDCRVLFAMMTQSPEDGFYKPDQLHLSEFGHGFAALDFAAQLISGREAMPSDRSAQFLDKKEAEPLRQLIVAKNRLWFDYWRVQNWAFLAGDRTNQPSSRDHLDPARRWFPEERERFLPLIEAKERAIDALAAKLATNVNQ